MRELEAHSGGAGDAKPELCQRPIINVDENLSIDSPTTDHRQHKSMV
jgi:hypothetical protein